MVIDYRLGVEGHLTWELREAASGIVTARRTVKNTILNTFRSRFAQWFTGTAINYPDFVGIGRGSATEYHSTNQDDTQAINTTTRQRLSQGIQVSAGVQVYSVCLYLVRLGSPVGTLLVEIQTDSGGSASGTAITNGVSSSVPVATMPSTINWVNFLFPTYPSLSATVQYHIVLKQAYTTYSAGVNEIQWGVDTSAPSYSNGTFQYYDGASWTITGNDGIFSVVQATQASLTALAQPIAYDGVNAAKAVTDNDVQSTYDARKAVAFTTAQANTRIREIGLFDAANSGNLWARALVDIDKTSAQILAIYWLTRIQAA